MSEPMSEMDPREVKIDSLLRRSMAAPVPSLRPDFDQRLMREMRRRSQPSNQFSRILLAGYGGLSAVISTVVMRGQGLGWGAITVMILGPLTLVATVPWVWRATHSTTRHSTSRDPANRISNRAVRAICRRSRAPPLPLAALNNRNPFPSGSANHANGPLESSPAAPPSSRRATQPCPDKPAHYPPQHKKSCNDEAHARAR